MKLENINEQMMYDVLSTPSFSCMEECMQQFLIEYAAKKEIELIQDAKGNVYLKKGKPADGGFYPCLTAHMDTVQWAQMEYVKKNEPISLIEEENSNGRHIIYAEDFGLGGDDKAGIVIALSIMDSIPVCKTVFFVEEEIGCEGSSHATLDWFKDVGYIIAYDAPKQNCASRSCSGVELFDKTFFDTYLAELGEKFGLTEFHDHPYTDVMILRQSTQLVCMNFGAGYYRYHSSEEYVVPEEMDHAVSMGLYLVNRLGDKQYVIPLARNGD